VGGVRKRCRVHMEWVCGNILEGDGRSFIILFVLGWGMGHLLVSGMIGGVGIVLRSSDFQFCLVLQGTKDAMVDDNLVVHNGVIQWNVLFTRQIQDWEIEMVLSFFDRIYFSYVRYGESDRLV
jgi:hypothetical protein